MYWAIEFLDILNFFVGNFHSKAIIRNLMFVSAAEALLMQIEMKMPINRQGKTRHSQLQSVKVRSLQRTEAWAGSEKIS